MPLIIEGPDCAGKTMLAKRLGSPTWKRTEFDPQQSMLAAAEALQWATWHIDAGRSCPIMDRWFYSEIIYGELRHGNAPRWDWLRLLEDQAFSIGTMVVWLVPPWEIVETRHARRGDDDGKGGGIGIELLRKIWEAYRDFYPRLPMLLHGDTKGIPTDAEVEEIWNNVKRGEHAAREERRGFYPSIEDGRPAGPKTPA